MGGHCDSYYAATAHAAPAAPALRGGARCDVAVVGGGFTGLSAALSLAERGYRVALLEARALGWGASGRNGGQVGSGQRVDERELAERHGRETARRLWDLAEAAKAAVHARIRRHAIDCDLRTGGLVAASKARDAAGLQARAARLAREYDYAHARYVPGEEMPEHLGTSIYHGGLLDAGVAHLHPLNYALGLARAAAEAGAALHAGSPVLRYRRGTPCVLETPEGTLEADYVVLACNAYLGRLEPRIAGRMMPINNFVIATEPLGAERARALIRDDVCVHDTRFVVNYYRCSADGRLLFGGGENYTRRLPRDIAGLVRRRMLGVYPQLADARIDYAWGGAVAITMTRMPHLGRLGPNVFFAQGYSGHGVATATLAGELIAEALAGTAERFDVFARLVPPPFPGGTLLRWPGLVLGMLYYKLRDRL